jgi:hypothetical protein
VGERELLQALAEEYVIPVFAIESGALEEPLIYGRG